MNNWKKCTFGARKYYFYKKLFYSISIIFGFINSKKIVIQTNFHRVWLGVGMLKVHFGPHGGGGGGGQKRPKNGPHGLWMLPN